MDERASAGAAPPPGRSAVSARAWWTAALYLLAAAMLLRFVDLPLKPLHHDEGVNTLFLTDLVRPPHTYRYDPANYHGPTLYYFAWLSVAVSGLTTAAIRGVTALAGLLLVLVVSSLRREIGAIGALAAAALLALSPGAVYFSRYFIHEMLLVSATVGTVAAAAAWWRSGRPIFLHAAAASAGLMFATKETAVITAVVLIGAIIGAAALCPGEALSRRDGQPPARRVASAMWGLAADAAARLRGRRVLLPVLLAAGVFLAVNVLFYTSLFTHPRGALDALRSFAIWTRTGTTAHTQPWHAYARWLAVAEGPLLLAGAAGAAWALIRRADRFAVFAALWAVGTFTAYSAIPYKTPWLALNMILPLAICGGHAVERLWLRFGGGPPARAVLRTVAATVLAVSGYQAIVLNFVDYDDNTHPYIYAHTLRDVLALVREVDRIQQANPGSTIAVTSRDHFPLSWYFRAYRAGFYGRPIVTGDPLVVASEEQAASLDPALGDRYERRGSYRLRPGVTLVLYVRRDLRAAATRGSLEGRLPDGAGRAIPHM